MGTWEKVSVMLHQCGWGGPLIEEVRSHLHNAGLDNDNIHALFELGYFTAPASKGHHLNWPGGLVEHSVNVVRRLCKTTRAFGVEWPRTESVYLVGMLHDLVKCRCYRERLNAAAGVPRIEYDYVQPSWPGHGMASAMIATVDLGIRLLPMEAAAIIHHMGAFGLQGRALNEFDAALDEFAPAIIATHSADWAAARIDEGGCFHDMRSEVKE